MWVSNSLLTFCSFSPGKKKKTPVRGNRCEKKGKEYYRSSWDPFLHFFLKIILEPVCLQRNRQKDGGRDKVLSYFSPFLQSDRGEEVKLTFTNNLGFRERKQNACFGLEFFFVWLGFFYCITTCQFE